jgi:RNA polymerase sigma-70 factor, ECF subfamily
MTDEGRNSRQMDVSDVELIAHIKKGNMDAFEQLVQRYDKRVLTIAAGYVNSADDAKDIFQEVFLRVYKSIPKFENRSEFSTWLFRITTNVCLTHRSRHKRHQHTSIDQHMESEDGSPITEQNIIQEKTPTDRRVQDREISDRVEKALQMLSPRQRMVFTMKHYEGYKIKEIAEMMKCSEGTIKKYLFEATARLRTQLQEFAE